MPYRTDDPPSRRRNASADHPRVEKPNRLTFVASDANGLPLKRRHVQSACKDCRVRKKRCQHVPSRDLQATPTFREERPEESLDESCGMETSKKTKHSALGDKADSRMTESSEVFQSCSSSPNIAASNNDDQHEEARFVGELNPEATFLSNSSLQATASVEDDDVGVWSTRRQIQNDGNSSLKPFRYTKQTSADSSNPVPLSTISIDIQEQSANMLPDESNYKGLSEVFFNNVHVIFPVLDQNRLLEISDASPNKQLLKQAICLAASTDQNAKRYLRFQNGQELSHEGFAKMLSASMINSINFGKVTDKVILIQALATLSLFTQLSDDSHFSAELLARAVSLVHTIGLHLKPWKTKSDHEFLTTLFCCVWALDRLNAAFHGRPVVMHERDSSRDLTQCFQQQKPCFQLFLRITLLLDGVINLYRPNVSTQNVTVELQFPNFEELVHISGAQMVPSHLLATTETLYHAVAMLSYRSRSEQEIPQASPAYIRQSLSAIRVTSIISEEFYHQLCLIPVVPYALSLALRVSYRELRTSKAPLFRKRARKLLLLDCSLLRELGDMFWSAVLMADLAEQTIREMDRIYSTILNEQQLKLRPKNSAAEDFNVNDATTQELNNGLELRSKQNIETVHDRLESKRSSGYDPNSFDLSTFDDVSEFDIFQYFDPNFDLEAIDASLGYDLDPSVVTSIGEYIH